MKKILFPILTSAALVPTIAATSCGFYLVQDITEFDTDHMYTEAKYACSDGCGYEFVVDFTEWDSANEPLGVFKLVDTIPSETEFNDLSIYYAFGDDTKITIGDEPATLEWGSTHAEIKISSDSSQLLQKIVRIRTSIKNINDDIAKYFTFEAW